MTSAIFYILKGYYNRIWATKKPAQSWFLAVKLHIYLTVKKGKMKMKNQML